MSEKSEIDKQLEEKYNQITKLVAEYNNLAKNNDHVSRVGSIITPGETYEEENEEDSYQEDYSTSGWWPSSLGC
jgi:hypothetical protein